MTGLDQMLSHLMTRLPNAPHLVPTSSLPTKNSPPDCFLYVETFTGSTYSRNSLFPRIHCFLDKNGGNNRARTYDPLLVRQMLSQLSYAPTLNKKSTPYRSAFLWRRHPDLNWGIRVLQTRALPLGYVAI